MSDCGHKAEIRRLEHDAHRWQATDEYEANALAEEVDWLGLQCRIHCGGGEDGMKEPTEALGKGSVTTGLDEVPSCGCRETRAAETPPKGRRHQKADTEYDRWLLPDCAHREDWYLDCPVLPAWVVPHHLIVCDQCGEVGATGLLGDLVVELVTSYVHGHGVQNLTRGARDDR